MEKTKRKQIWMMVDLSELSVLVLLTVWGKQDWKVQNMLGSALQLTKLRNTVLHVYTHI